MGRRHSDSDDSSYSKSYRKKKRRSRSRSSSGSSTDSRSYRSRKNKKSSRRHRSRSRSTERYRRKKYRDSRSRSRSRDRRRSRSRSYGRSRSHSRSPSRYRKGRSRSRSRYRSRSRTPPRKRSKSPRRRRSRSVSSSRSSRRGKDSRGSSQLKTQSGSSVAPSKLAEIQLQMALKAAAAADEKLKEAGLLPQGVGRSVDDVTLSLQEQTKRINAIESIEEDGFEPATFTSSRQQKASSHGTATAEATHDNAIFSALPLDIQQDAAVKTKLTGSIMHPNLFVPMEVKMERWRKKLIEMRNRKLEGEVM